MSEEKKNNETAAQAKPEKKERKNKKDDEIQKLKEELEIKQDLLLRTAAEFDNFKKRTERERISTVEYSKANVIKKNPEPITCPVIKLTYYINFLIYLRNCIFFNNSIHNINS